MCWKNRILRVWASKENKAETQGHDIYLGRVNCDEVSEGYWVPVVERWAESEFMVSNMMLVKE